MSDLDARIARLRRKLEAADDPDDRADLEAAIAALEAQRPAKHSITIQDQAQVSVAVAGDVHGNVYLDGRRADADARRLAAYLLRLRGSCGTLPLEGMRQQSQLDDRLRIGLDQVYTQLTVEGRVLRDELRGAALRDLDLAAYIKQHTGDELLPWQRRTMLERPLTSQERAQKRADVEAMLPTDAPFSADRVRMADRIGQRLDALDVKDLVNKQSELDWMKLFGPRLATDAIADQSRLVLLGEPGSGKSTALRYLALTLAEAGLDEHARLEERLAGWDRLAGTGKLLPIFMPLLPFARRLAADRVMSGTADELWDAIADHLEPGDTRTGLAVAVHAELEAGNALLLLDGLDEVATAESRQKVVRAVDQFAVQYSQCRIVVTCRVRAYEGEQNAAWQLPSWPTATLAPWDATQQRHFIAAWYDAAVAADSLPASQRDERVQALQRAVAGSPDLRRLADRPLLLTIMALVHLNDGRLPEDRVTLYSRCLDILLAQWELRGKEGSIYGSLMAYIDLAERDIQRLRPLLSQAAYVAHTSGNADSPGSLGRDRLRLMVADHLATLGHADAYHGAQRFLEYTDLRAGLLQASAAGDAYVFPHLTFQEYLAGLELVRGVDFVDRIMAVRAEDRWRVPILLGIGHTISEGVLSASHQVLSRLLVARERDPMRRERDLILAAEIGDDISWDRLGRGGDEFLSLRDALARELAQVVEGTALPAAERVRAGVLLGHLGDPRPGICTLPPRMVEISGDSFVIGSSAREREQALELFERTYDRSDKDRLRDAYRNVFEDEQNERPVFVATFEIARYPVTNAQYALFMASGGYNPNQPWWDDAGRAWLARDDASTLGRQSRAQRRFKDRPEQWDDERFGAGWPNHPIVGVSWYEAMAFCRWLTQHKEYNPEGYTYTLPSEAEWEYAARGTMRRTFPWGEDDPDGERANFNRIYQGTTAVGCFVQGATPEGVFDLAGNVWEWTRSEFRPYPYDPGDGREAADEPSNKRFTLRGGGWIDPPIFLRASDRDDDTPDSHYDDVGFRLARHPPV